MKQKEGRVVLEALENNKREVLNGQGYVEIVDMMGDDYRILETARVSTGAQARKGDEKDRNLIRYLYKNQHMTPFESVVTTWKVKAPLFIVNQLERHRSMSFNEESTRYTQMNNEYYIPESFRQQSTSNKQSSTGIVDNNSELIYDYTYSIEDSFGNYESLIEDGVAREQARMVLPVALMKNLFITVNLRNLFHFLELRLDEHAQYEIRVYAEAILNILKSIDGLKWSIEVFEEIFQLNQCIQWKLKEEKDVGYFIDYVKKYETKSNTL